MAEMTNTGLGDRSTPHVTNASLEHNFINGSSGTELTLPVPRLRSVVDPTHREEILAMRAEDRWSRSAGRDMSKAGNQTDARRPWRSMIETAPPCDEQPSRQSRDPATSGQERSSSAERLYKGREYKSRDFGSEQPMQSSTILDHERLGLRPGWAKKALAAGVGKSVPPPSDQNIRVLKREHAFYCTSKGMIPGILSFTRAVLTFEPTSGADFQCIISIADIWEVASIVVPKTTAVEDLFNLPPSSDVIVPTWIKPKTPAAGENPNPSLALVQILLKQKKGQSTQKLTHPSTHGGRRDSLHRTGDLRRVGSKDTTPASATYMEDYHTINRSATQSTSPQLPRHFILFRVPTCTSAREITKSLLNLIRQINDNSRHFTYVPYYSQDALNDLIRCSSMTQDIDQDLKDAKQTSFNEVCKTTLTRDDLFDSTASPQEGGLTQSMMNELSWRMPPTIALRKWELLFDTRCHGVSMQTFFSKIAGHSPALLCILDSNDYLFGGYNSTGFCENRHYYGSGECFVFTFGQIKCPKLETYHWTGSNNLFVYSNHDRIVFGGGGFKAEESTPTTTGWAFAIDSNLLSGTSAISATFDNPVLSGSDDWLIQRVQVWGFDAL